jgi:hypothetical protein
MKRLVLSFLSISTLVTGLYATQVQTCTVLRNYDFGSMKIDCGSGHTTLSEMYSKGWKFVGSSASGAGGTQVILEK